VQLELQRKAQASREGPTLLVERDTRRAGGIWI